MPRLRDVADDESVGGVAQRAPGARLLARVDDRRRRDAETDGPVVVDAMHAAALEQPVRYRLAGGIAARRLGEVLSPDGRSDAPAVHEAPPRMAGLVTAVLLVAHHRPGAVDVVAPAHDIAGSDGPADVVAADAGLRVVRIDRAGSLDGVVQDEIDVARLRRGGSHQRQRQRGGEERGNVPALRSTGFMFVHAAALPRSRPGYAAAARARLRRPREQPQEQQEDVEHVEEDPGRERDRLLLAGPAQTVEVDGRVEREDR